ncbi:MAG: hypothetical protein IPL32_02215 [Chloracidobacterium sp.]|nr:hypothetical protein [Chloracidobacterium sp.]
MNILKGIGAILAGFIFIGVTHNGTDYILESLGIFTPLNVRFDTTWMVITATIYRNLFMIAAGYLTAAIAPEPKMRYVIILGIIGTLMGILGIVVNTIYDLGSVWYPYALVLLGFPCLYLGAKLKIKE